MCIVALVVVIGLLVFYLDDHLSNWHLVERLDAHSEITLAVGWEMIPAFWPLIALSVISTLVLVMLYQRIFNKKQIGCATCPTDEK
ncbi:MAG: hypothetical protein AB7D03_02245 [Thiomicrospira sp.]